MRKIADKIKAVARKTVAVLVAVPTDRMNHYLHVAGYLMMTAGIITATSFEGAASTIAGLFLMVLSLFFLFEELITRLIDKYRNIMMKYSTIAVTLQINFSYDNNGVQYGQAAAEALKRVIRPDFEGEGLHSVKVDYARASDPDCGKTLFQTAKKEK